MKRKDNFSFPTFEDFDTSTDNGMSRRKWLKRLGILPLATVMSGLKATPVNSLGSLPAKDLFDVKGTFINAAFTHPMSKATAAAVQAYVRKRQDNDFAAVNQMNLNRTEVKELFAKLINAKPAEVAWVPSTMVGENFIVSGLGIPGTSARVVTDMLHFDGSLYLYGQLSKNGVDVQVVRPRENKIDLKDLETAITPGTKLVSLSLVSTVNGFQHDLKAVCDLAHSRGAFVFADIIQAAGAVPIDVRASGVDFCACASYKWLMGDFGAGFLYVRQDRLDRLKRTQYGYRQIKDFTSHAFPYDSPGTMPYEWESTDDVGGYFQVGTYASGAIAALRDSLSYLLETGVNRIQDHRQALLRKLQTELPKLGYTPMTPMDSTSPIVTFAFKDADRILKPRLDAANINISVYQNRFRISPSVYNDMADINKLIETLS